MILHSFNAQSIKETELVFPQEIESNTQIFYHGTSCVFSGQIEENGFDIKYRPYTLVDLINIANAIKNIDPKTSAYLSRWADNPIRLSLAKKSYIASQYAVASRGGQTLSFIRPFLHIQDLIPEHLSTLLTQAETTASCVYAISICDLPSNGYSIERGVCYMNISIPRENIIGKVIIPKGILLTDLKKPSLQDIVDSITIS
ncbi:MAG: hypothetical protein OJI67_14290 [Prosthecobacter sp.]|nr:hypothetical protein [Prosthecobacter sp.]